MKRIHEKQKMVFIQVSRIGSENGTVKTSTILHFQYNTKFLKSKKALII
jgi:hypothetical protein